jgi:crotonobetainyl-CoA:carnitine CoA-transferase CaiB-like acyl-CoA transferase
MALPFEGTRIIDASTVLAAPLSASLLAELGAEVIKVEEPVGGDPTRGFGPHVDGASAHYKVTNRNKKSVTLDLRSPEGAALLVDLCRTADALVINYRPSTMESWGLTWERIHEANPRLVMLHLTAFGRTGPYRDHPGFARVAEAFAGLTHITGEPDGPPYFPGYPIADGVGGVYGAFLLAVGLYHRRETGEGQLIDLALYEPVLRMMEDFVVRYGLTGEVKGRSGNDQPHSCPNGIFPTADGQYVVLPVSTPNMWRRLLPFLEDRDGLLNTLDTAPKRVARRPDVNAAVARFTTQHRRDDLIELLRSNGIACGTVNTVADICADPQVRERGNLTEVHDEETGQALLVQAPIGRFSTITTRVASGPALGNDTDDVLATSLKLGAQRIAELRTNGVIR